MKVIRKGRDLSQIAVCDVCGCEFAFLPGEIKHGEREFYNVPVEYTKKHGGEYGPCKITTYRYVVCPCCKLEVPLDKEDGK